MADNDFTEEERTFLTNYFHDRDRRSIKGFSLTKPEIVAILRANKLGVKTRTVPIAEKISEVEFTTLLDLSVPKIVIEEKLDA